MCDMIFPSYSYMSCHTRNTDVLYSYMKYMCDMVYICVTWYFRHIGIRRKYLCDMIFPLIFPSYSYMKYMCDMIFPSYSYMSCHTRNTDVLSHRGIVDVMLHINMSISFNTSIFLCNSIRVHDIFMTKMDMSCHTWNTSIWRKLM